jgi:hypothetical protein
MLGAVTKLHAFQPSASGSDYFTLTGTPGTIFMMPSATKKNSKEVVVKINVTVHTGNRRPVMQSVTTLFTE